MESDISGAAYENILLIGIVIAFLIVIISRPFIDKKYSILHDRGNFYLFIGSASTALSFLIVLIAPLEVTTEMSSLIDLGIILGFGMTGYGEKIHYIKHDATSKLYSIWKYRICLGISLFWGMVTIIELII